MYSATFNLILLALCSLVCSALWLSPGFAEQQDDIERYLSKPYHGKLISLDFNDADIRSVLRALGRLYKRNIVLHQGVQGKLNLRLRDVPLDQAFQAILRTADLYAVTEGNITMIYPLGEFAEKIQ